MINGEPRFACASIHLFSECNLKCSFCYRDKEKHGEKSLYFWKEIIPYFRELEIPQVAIGGGEPLLRPDWIKALSKRCKEQGIYFNMTTNGRLIQEVPLDTFKDVTMVSISYDSEKIKTLKDSGLFFSNIVYLKENFPNIKVGCNYLCDDFGLPHMRIFVEDLFEWTDIDRVFALCPKNFKSNILKYRKTYVDLTLKYPNFMVDDLTKCIIEAGRYKDWSKPCHFGKIVSIDEQGNVGGCSFDLGKIDFLKLREPKDILLVKDMEFKERTSCPYLMV